MRRAEEREDAIKENDDIFASLRQIEDRWKGGHVANKYILTMSIGQLKYISKQWKKQRPFTSSCLLIYRINQISFILIKLSLTNV